jgi:transposase-like protein
MGTRKNFDKEFKQQVVQELLTGKTTAQVSREHQIKYDLARRWLREYKTDPQGFASK